MEILKIETNVDSIKFRMHFTISTGKNDRNLLLERLLKRLKIQLVYKLQSQKLSHNE